jgi:hypothetical protein
MCGSWRSDCYRLLRKVWRSVVHTFVQSRMDAGAGAAQWRCIVSKEALSLYAVGFDHCNFADSCGILCMRVMSTCTVNNLSCC